MNYSIDMLGNLCPAPLDALIKAGVTARSDDTITIVFDCAQATENIPAWCASNGYTVLSLKKTDVAKWCIVVRKDK